MGTGISFLVFPFGRKDAVRIAVCIMCMEADCYIQIAVIGMGMATGLCSLCFNISTGIVMVGIRMVFTDTLCIIRFQLRFCDILKGLVFTGPGLFDVDLSHDPLFCHGKAPGG